MKKALSKLAIKTIIGLGNGHEYNFTPHNIGEDFVRWKLKQSHVLFMHQKLYDCAAFDEIMYVIPKTYMNNSGQVLPFLKQKGFWDGNPQSMLVISDDIQVQWGKFQLRIDDKRGLRGHNGLRSIAQQLQEMKISGIPYFLSIGIMPQNVEKTPDFVKKYVLQRFTTSEKNLIEESIFPSLNELFQEFIR